MDVFLLLEAFSVELGGVLALLLTELAQERLRGVIS